MFLLEGVFWKFVLDFFRFCFVSKMEYLIRLFFFYRF